MDRFGCKMMDFLGIKQKQEKSDDCIHNIEVWTKVKTESEEQMPLALILSICF